MLPPTIPGISSPDKEIIHLSIEAMNIWEKGDVDHVPRHEARA